MSNLLTCMGEVLIDFLPIDADGVTTGFTLHPGGGPFNVAVGLARLDQPVAFAGKTAADFFGRTLRAYAEAEGIDTRFLLRTDHALSTLAFVAHEAGEPVFTFYGEGTADSLLLADELPDALFAETNLLHFGGISLLRGTTPAAVLATAQRLKGRALLSFDPNMRPTLIRDERAYRALLQQLFELAEIIKLSAADCAWLSPGAPVEQVAADLLAQGAALVVVTQGGKGVLALRETETGPTPTRVPTFMVTVADTVGAGDAFSAGLLAGLAERAILTRDALAGLAEEELIAALRFAAATAALTCARPGANPPRRAEVAAFLSAA